jgi:AcrR family transcriptional regulator
MVDIVSSDASTAGSWLGVTLELGVERRRYLFRWHGVMSSRASRATTAAGTRARIVDSAIELFARGGYAGTSVLAIAERAGISDAGVLYHFATKRDLFVAVVDVFTELQADTFRELLAPGGFVAIQNLAGWGAVMEARPDLLAVQIVLSAEAIAPGAELHTYWASRHTALLELLAGLFREGIERGQVRADIDPVFEASALCAHLDGARLQWFYSGQRASIARSFETYVALLADRIALADR